MMRYSTMHGISKPWQARRRDGDIYGVSKVHGTKSSFGSRVTSILIVFNDSFTATVQKWKVIIWIISVAQFCTQIISFGYRTHTIPKCANEILDIEPDLCTRPRGKTSVRLAERSAWRNESIFFFKAGHFSLIDPNRTLIGLGSSFVYQVKFRPILIVLDEVGQFWSDLASFDLFWMLQLLGQALFQKFHQLCTPTPENCSK